MPVHGENGRAGKLFWVALITGFAVSLILAFAVYSMHHYSLLLPQAAGFIIAILLLGIGPGSTTFFLLIMVTINAVAYAGVIFVLLVAFQRPDGS